MQSKTYVINFRHEETHWWFLARREIILMLIRRMIEQQALPQPPFRTLDYGCGTGSLTRSLNQFGDVCGVDESEEAIQFCHQRGMDNVKRIQSLNELSDETYDLIGCFDVLEHIDDDMHILGEFKRMLKPGGILFLTVPALKILWGGEDVVSQHKRRYRRKDLVKKQRQSGYEIIKASYFNTLLFPFILAVRLFNRGFRPERLSQSDVQKVSPLLNTVLCRLFALERIALKDVTFPIGASLLTIAKKSPMEKL